MKSRSFSSWSFLFLPWEEIKGFLPFTLGLFFSFQRVSQNSFMFSTKVSPCYSFSVVWESPTDFVMFEISCASHKFYPVSLVVYTSALPNVFTTVQEEPEEGRSFSRSFLCLYDTCWAWTKAELRRNQKVNYFFRENFLISATVASKERLMRIKRKSTNDSIQRD